MTGTPTTRECERLDDRDEDRDGDDGLVRLSVFVVGVMTLGFLCWVAVMVAL